jgi:hypothetical protein
MVYDQNLIAFEEIKTFILEEINIFMKFDKNEMDYHNSYWEGNEYEDTKVHNPAFIDVQHQIDGLQLEEEFYNDEIMQDLSLLEQKNK